MESALWTIAPYTAFLSFVLGHLWRWRHDRFDSRRTTHRTDPVYRAGLTLLRVGLVCVVAARVTEMLSARAHSHMASTPVIVLEALAVPAAIIGAVVVLLPDVLNPSPRQPVTPIDRATLPILIAGLLSGVIIAFDPNSTDTENGAADTLFVWFPALFTLHPQPEAMVHAPVIYQARGLIVLTIIGIWPYTRLAGILALPLARGLRRASSTTVTAIGLFRRS
jgi:nitrate reductase gamma subunit